MWQLATDPPSLIQPSKVILQDTGDIHEIPSSFFLHILQVLAKIPKTLLSRIIPNMNPWLLLASAPDQYPLAWVRQRLPKYPADIPMHLGAPILWLSTLSSPKCPSHVSLSSWIIWTTCTVIVSKIASLLGAAYALDAWSSSPVLQVWGTHMGGWNPHLMGILWGEQCFCSFGANNWTQTWSSLHDLKLFFAHLKSHWCHIFFSVVKSINLLLN